jgi:leucyl/phenylalanyl-tRNA--protein transferase
MLPWLSESDPFPSVESALTRPNGLLAAGADLSRARLVAAYGRGIFPWFGPGEPVLWWSPDPRMVLFPDEFRTSRSLAKRLRRRDYEVRADTAFPEVMQACAAPRSGQAGTWITDDMRAAYGDLHEAGIAHSVEIWMQGELVGDLYGVALGGAFFGESMFSRVRDASKMALAGLVEQLGHWGYGMIDCQMETAHLASLGARPIPRREFIRRLDVLLNLPGKPGKWTFEHDPVE